MVIRQEEIAMQLPLLHLIHPTITILLNIEEATVIVLATIQEIILDLPTAVAVTQVRSLGLLVAVVVQVAQAVRQVAVEDVNN